MVLLEMFLPVILAQRAWASEKVLADPDQRNDVDRY
jgi:hypothetical protein